MYFDETTLRKLDQLSLVAARVRAGHFKGERRSTKRGTSIEFADYRDYVRGDDLRRVDWNVYARLERPFVKLFEEEEDLAVHLVVDSSRSMAYPDDPETNKFHYAARLAAALGHVALAAGDRLTVWMLRDGEMPARFGPRRGRGYTVPLVQYLSAQSPSGALQLNAAMSKCAQLADRAGLTFIISDLFAPGGYEAGLAALQSRGHEVTVLHVLSPDELDPPLAGDLRLLDSETGDPQDVTIDGGIRELYRRRVQLWQEGIEAHCNKRGAHYVPLNTQHRWDRVVLYQLRRMGVVK